MGRGAAELQHKRLQHVKMQCFYTNAQAALVPGLRFQRTYLRQPFMHGAHEKADAVPQVLELVDIGPQLGLADSGRPTRNR